MPTATKPSKSEIETMIRELSALTLCIEHNSGTFGAEECCRKTGCGEARYGEYEIWEDIRGKRTVIGCDPEHAPGYARYCKEAKRDLSEARKKLAELRRELSR
jgi:hypothetical protein